MYLFFDTETTGLPNNWNAPVTDTRNWPRMVQIAYLISQSDGTIVENKNYIIKPDGYTIPLEVSRIHGITTERANREGVELSTVLAYFQTLLTKATSLVAHNMEFDEKILGCEFYRTTGQNPLTSKQKFCTMKSPSVISHCAIPPFRYGNYKWPKLSELHEKLFGTDFEEAHNASIDMQITAKCFWELKRRGII
jgi:DNA polymerase-3 subunit epsilon